MRHSKIHIVTVFLLSILASLPSCEWIWSNLGSGLDYPTGDLPEHPVNLEEFNSVYDDYNSTAPTLGFPGG